MSLKNRLNAHFAAAAAVAATAVVATPSADAAIVYSGPVSINIPDNLDGVYMNIVTGATGTAGGSVAGWDINPYTAGVGTFNLWGPTANTYYNPQGVVGGNYNLPSGTSISGAAAVFFRPGGTNIGAQFNLNSSNNLIGFRFVNEAMGNAVQFGWARLSFGSTLGIRSIVEYAYEDSGAAIQAGIVPAPGALALLGLAGLVGSRRRRVA